MSRVIADWPQPRLWLDRAKAAIHGCAGVGGILDHAMKGGGPPPCRARTGSASSLLELATDLAQAEAVEPDPGKDQADKYKVEPVISSISVPSSPRGFPSGSPNYPITRCRQLTAGHLVS